MTNALTKTDQQIEAVKDTLEKMKEDFYKALPKMAGLEVENYIKTALTALRKNPVLLECTEVSLLTSLIQAAQLGLPLDPMLGQAYLIPYKGECTMIVGYRGMTSICHRYGEINNIHAVVVYENDEFSYTLGSNPDLKHTPTMKDRGEVVGVYAIVVHKNGHRHFRVLHSDEVKKCKAAAKTDKVWKAWPDEMWKKTAVRKIFKDVPLSLEMASAVKQAENHFDMDFIDIPCGSEKKQISPPKAKSETAGKKSIKSQHEAIEKFAEKLYEEGVTENVRVTAISDLIGLDKPVDKLDDLSFDQASKAIKIMSDTIKAAE